MHLLQEKSRFYDVTLSLIPYRGKFRRWKVTNRKLKKKNFLPLIFLMQLFYDEIFPSRANAYAGIFISSLDLDYATSVYEQNANQFTGWDLKHGKSKKSSMNCWLYLVLLTLRDKFLLLFVCVFLLCIVCTINTTVSICYMFDIFNFLNLFIAVLKKESHFCERDEFSLSCHLKYFYFRKNITSIVWTMSRVWIYLEIFFFWKQCSFTFY